MGKVFLPYIDNKPKPIWVNGHKLIIVTNDDDSIEDSSVFSGSSVWAKSVEYASEELESVLGEIAKQHEAGIVMAPNDISLEEVVASLEQELPWIQ